MKVLRYILTMVVCALWCQSMMAQGDRQFVRNGNRLYRAQNYAKAEIEYRKALSKNPRNTQAMYNLGCALMMQQKDSAATIQLENAGKSETAKIRKSKAYHNIGVICQKHQMYGEAIEAYKESLRNNPSDNETRYNLALCKRLAKNQKKNDKNKNKQQNKNNKNNKDKQNKDNKDKKNQNSEKNKQQQQPKDRMSKENAEQLLNYAVQEEKATQQRMKQQQQQPQQRKLQKNW